MKHSRFFIIKRICVILIGLAAAFWGVFMGYHAALNDYFNNSASAFAIPDSSQGFIPQGITYDPASRHFFLTGYMGSGGNSPIYVMDRADGTLKKKILMLNEKGEKFKGHAGGLSVYGDQLYIAGSTDACLYAFPIAEVLAAEDRARLAAGSRIDLKNAEDFIRVSFTSFDQSLLYAGEFHCGPIFNTDSSHRVEDAGIKQQAYLLGAALDGGSRALPACVFSIPDNVQGACFADGYLYLSQSRGFLPGRVLTYRLDEIASSGSKKVLGLEVPLYIVTEKTAAKVTVVPPMPEEIVVVDGEMYVLSEAASDRYRLGKPLKLDRVYKTPISFFQ